MDQKVYLAHRCRWLFVLLGLALVQFTWAQRTITGTVTDAQTGELLIGANILAVGTNSGTVTDLDGAFSLDLQEEVSEIQISYTGYTGQTIELTNADTYTVQLDPGSVLGEVVVVGYGTVKKGDATGAVLALEEKDFNQGVIASPEQLLQGRAAGVQITGASGEPGAGVNVRIRGTSSVRNGNNPLFVVDGMPLDGRDISANAGGDQDESFFGAGESSSRNPLNFINPADIENISVLKDASATAIYGSRGANGVILITTKSGSGGNQGLTYRGSVGLSTVTRRYDLLTADEFLAGQEAVGNDPNSPAINRGSSTDWQDEVLRTAITNQHDLSYGGGNAESNYRLSIGYLNQEGVVENSGLRRLTARLNARHKVLNDRVTLAGNVTVAGVQDENPMITNNSGFEGDIIGAMISANPTRPVRLADGSFDQPSVDQLNPAAILEFYDDRTNTTRVLASASIDVEIIRGLNYKINGGIDRSSSTRRTASSGNLVMNNIANNNGRASINDINLTSFLIEHTLNYNTTFGRSQLDALVGYSYQDFDFRSHTVQAQQFQTTDTEIMLNNLTSADFNNFANAYRNRSSRTFDNLQSYFGRVNFTLAGKYLFTATVRADGSSKFGSDNRYGIFPSGAVAWRVSEEDWMSDAFSDFKLRLAYGITGNQEIPSGQNVNRFRYNNDGNLERVAFENPNLQWEETSQINGGIDFGFLNGRIYGSIDGYHKVTTDLLIRVVSAEPAPQPFTWTNLGADVLNTGFEFILNGAVVESPNFTFDVAFNVAYNRNIVRGDVGLINTGGINGQGLTGAFAQRIADGQPLYSYFMRDFAGFDEDSGNSLYRDPDGNVLPEGQDQVFFVGRDPLPEWTGGLNLAFTFFNFDVSAFFDGQFGAWIYNNTANAFFTKGSFNNARNVTTDVPGNAEGLLNAPDVSTRFLEDGSFVRFTNLNIGYTFNVANINAISNLRLFFTGQNLFIIDSYSGQDPEVNTNKSLDGVPSLGIDFTAYPRSRIFNFGVSVTFQ